MTPHCLMMVIWKEAEYQFAWLAPQFERIVPICRGLLNWELNDVKIRCDYEIVYIGCAMENLNFPLNSTLNFDCRGYIDTILSNCVN